MTALQIIALTLALQFAFQVSFIVWFFTGAKGMFKKILPQILSSNDVEQDMETFDEGYITCMTDFLNQRFKKHLDSPGTGSFEQCCKHFTKFVLVEINDMPKFKQIGFFAIDEFSRRIVFETETKMHQQ